MYKHSKMGADHENRHLANIFRKAGNVEVPCLILHDNLDEPTAFAYEQAFIKAIGRADLGEGPLCNLTCGGEGASGFSEDTLEKMRVAATGRTHSETAKQKVSDFNKGKAVSSETRQKISKALKARIASGFPPNGFGRKVTESQRATIGNIHRGKIVSPETRKKQSISRTGIRMSEETRARMREAKIGKTYSDEQRSAISAGLKQYHARRRAESAGAQ